MAAGGQGRKELRSLRFKAETTPGTKSSPRHVFRGNGEMIEDQREVKLVDEQVGHFGGSDRTYIPKLLAGIKLASTPATFEQLPDLLMMAGIGTSGGGNWAGSAQGASGSTVVFTLAVPDTTTPLGYPSYTVEGGDSESGGSQGWAEVVEYVLADEVKLDFKGGDAMMMSASLTGRQGTATNTLGTFSNVGTLPVVEEILAGLGTFYLTPAGSGYGTGQVTSGNILAGNISFKTKWARKFPVDSGALYFSTAVFADIEVTGELTLESQVSGTYGVWGSTGQKEKWRNETPQLIRMQWPGATIPAGTTILTKLLQIDLPIKWTKFAALSDMDGNDVVVGQFFSKWSDQNIAASGRGTITIARLGTSEFAGA